MMYATVDYGTDQVWRIVVYDNGRDTSPIDMPEKKATYPYNDDLTDSENKVAAILLYHCGF